MNLESNPFELFTTWYEQAQSCPTIKEANAMNLATATAEGRPSSRMVLFKSYDEQGWVFFTNLESRKGGELAQNPYVACCIFWEDLNKQVRIEGKVEAITDEEADEYFYSRPLQSRIGAWVSKQSRPLEKPQHLAAQLAKQSLAMASSKIKRPDHWSGFRVKPEVIEFWQRGDHRLHQRLHYRLDGENWNTQWLYP